LTPFIKCAKLSFEYGGKTVLEGVDFELCDGDFLHIVGANGSGKSTLVKGLLKLKEAARGKIIFSKELSPAEISYLAQTTPAQKDFPASVWEVVSSGVLSKNGLKFWTSKTDRKNIETALKRLNVFGLKNKCFRELSGGQQQRVLIARALCSKAKLLILDEPSSGLDPLAQENLNVLLKQLNQEEKIAIITVSHNVKDLNETACKILHLANKQLFFGEAKDYLNSETGKKWTGCGGE